MCANTRGNLAPLRMPSNVARLTPSIDALFVPNIDAYDVVYKRLIAGCAFLVELAFLDGREPLAGYDVHSLISYDAE